MRSKAGIQGNIGISDVFAVRIKLPSDIGKTVFVVYLWRSRLKSKTDGQCTSTERRSGLCSSTLFSSSARMPRRPGDEPGDAPRQQITLTAEELVEGRAPGASSLRSVSHIGSTWRVRHVTLQGGFVIFMFQHAERPEVFMTTRLMRMEMY